MRSRRVGTWVMVVLSTQLAMGTVLAWWASGPADAETHAAQATETLALDDVNQLVAERLAECQGVRHRQPGILAVDSVDSVDIGDTFAVVNDLNQALASG